MKRELMLEVGTRARRAKAWVWGRVTEIYIATYVCSKGSEVILSRPLLE